MENRVEDRSKSFMKPFDDDDIKRRRGKNQVSLRKSKRNEIAQSKRNLQINQRDWIQINDHYKALYTLEDINELVAAMRSDDENQHLFAAQGFRKILSLARQPPVQEVIDSGIMPFLIQWIQRDDFPQLQYEASWVMTNIASGSHQHVNVIVQKGAVPLIIRLLESPIEEVREQCVWALGNIGGDAAHYRDLILQNRGLTLLIKCGYQTTKQSMIKNLSWAVSNLCRGKPSPQYEQVKEALPYLVHVLQTQEDSDILADCLWGLSHLSDNGRHKVDDLIATQVTPRIVQLLSHHIYHVQLPALRTVGNIVTGDEKQTQVAVENGVIPAIALLLTSPKKNVRKEAVWSVSNLCAGTQDQLQLLINSDVFTKIINICGQDNPEIKREAVWALSNAVSGGTMEQVNHLVQQGVINALVQLLDQKDARLLSVALEGLKNTLKKGSMYSQQDNPYAVILEASGGLEKLEKLQYFPNVTVYEKSLKIIEGYFEVEDDENADLLNMIRGSGNFAI